MRTFRFKLAASLGLVLSLGAAGPVEPTATIYRDAWGTPHVFSDTDQGAVFGMAWALAEDDWPLMEENYLHALGRHAELAGEASVADDWMGRALELAPLSMREYRQSTPRIRGLLDAYAAGLNAWLAGQPAARKRVLQSIEPWYPLALIRYKYYQNEYLGYAGLRSGWAKRLMENGLPVGKRTGALETPASPEELRYYEAQFDELGLRPRGSNEWAVAPSRTAAGHALLLINPHQSFVGVQRYAEIHLDSREGLRFSGLTVFGFLLPYMGHNQRLGWAYTDNDADHSDLYAEVFDDPARPLHYKYDAGYRSAETWTDSIRVRVGDALQTRAFRFYKTHHGPLVGIDNDGRPLAAKLARMQEGGWFAQWDEMIRARTLPEWKKAMARLNVAYMNTMYADADGNIGYVYASAVPRRKPGVDPRGILNGTTSNTEWQGFHSFEELPQVFNPGSGWLLNTNSTPFTATIGLPYKREDFPAYMVGREDDNARAKSSRRVLENLRTVTFDQFADKVLDTRLSMADSMLPILAGEWTAAQGQPGTVGKTDVAIADLEPVIERLKSWDRVARAESVETTWFIITFEQHMRVRTTTPQLLVALAQALELLKKQYGTVDVVWGTINRHQRPLPGAPATVLDTARPSLAIDGSHSAVGSVFTFATRSGAVSPRLGVAGNSFVKIIEFGPQVRARSILNYGQSGDPASPHFFDQAHVYARKQFKPAWFAREDVIANAKRSYTVGSR
jgi:acyl-homoserine-lactone acylase